MTDLIARFRDDESGATAIEYGMIAVFIAVAILASIQALGATVLTNLFEEISGAFS